MAVLLLAHLVSAACATLATETASKTRENELAEVLDR